MTARPAEAEAATASSRGTSADAELRRLSCAVEQSADSIIITDRQGVIEYVNGAFERITGYSKSEALGRCPNILKSDHHGPEFFEELWRTILAGRVFRAVLTNRRKTGELFYEEKTITPLRDGRGAITHFVSTGKDITDRVRAEAALRESEARLRTTLENVADGVVAVGEAGVIESFNPAAERIFGYRAEEVIGRSVNMLMPDPYRDKHDGYIRRYLRTGEAQAIGLSREMTGQRKDGSTFPLEVKLGETQVGDHRLFIATIRDLTEPKRAERELLAAKEQAELASRAKSEFLANISHELRTPLNAIIGFSDIIREGSFGPVGDPRYVECAAHMGESGRHLLGLITDILDLSRVEAGRLGLGETDVDVATLVASCLNLVKGRAGAGGLRFAADLAPDLPLLRADEGRLRKIVLGLLSNAVKFTPRGGRITVKASVEPGGTLALRVIDTGIGIAPEDIPKALAPFSQVESALTRTHQGAGLGLALVEALVKLHQGTLELDSTVGAGTTVTVRFPAERLGGDRVVPLRPRARPAGT